MLATFPMPPVSCAICAKNLDKYGFFIIKYGSIHFRCAACFVEPKCAHHWIKEMKDERGVHEFKHPFCSICGEEK